MISDKTQSERLDVTIGAILIGKYFIYESYFSKFTFGKKTCLIK